VNKPRLVAAMLLCFAAAEASAGDATSNTSPAVATALGTAGAACANQHELALTSTGTPIKCTGGIWKHQAMSGIYKTGRTELIYPADVGTFKTIRVDCPTGKKPIGGGCVFFHQPVGPWGPWRTQSLVINSPTTDFVGWQCTWGPVKVWGSWDWIDPSGNTRQAEATTGVTCADY
jgi:hypothetical protein